MLLVEGQFGVNMTNVPSWTWDPKARSWEKMAGLGGPSPGCSLAWDAKAGRAICFVDTYWRGRPNASFAEVVDNVSETRVYDAAADAWQRLDTKGTPTPGLLGARKVYDSKAGRMVLFGGYVLHGQDIGYKNETWTLDLASSTWTRMEPAASPSPRNYHEMVYDEGSNRTIVFGSDANDDRSTWSYDLTANSWTRIDMNPMPETLVYAGMVYLPELGGSILFGGVNDDEKPRGGTWFFTVKDGWKKLETKIAPSARAWHAMAWDPKNKRIWLYGGGSKRSTATSELWYWDLKDRNWHKVERDAASLES
ncbi:MAG: hypothetical protein E4H20_05990 [Spirochaetales bacterium]|nr:MAG: hypothetical protein E4H20_05990 [Spirochaetales bacterium]